MKIRPVGAEVFHEDGQAGRQTDRQTDRRTDMTKLTAAFRNFRTHLKTATCCCPIGQRAEDKFKNEYFSNYIHKVPVFKKSS